MRLAKLLTAPGFVVLLANVGCASGGFDGETPDRGAQFGTRTHANAGKLAVDGSTCGRFINQTLGASGEVFRWVNDPDCNSDSCDSQSLKDIDFADDAFGLVKSFFSLSKAGNNACWACRNFDHFTMNGLP